MKIAEIASAAVAAVTGVSDALAVQWTKHRYIELASIGPLKPFRDLYEVTIPALVDTGTVTTTRGSTEVTGNSAAQAVWDQDIIGRFLRTTSNWYEIVGLTSGSAIVLKSEFAETAVSAGTYNIAPRRIALERGVRFIGAFVNMRHGIAMEAGSLNWMDSEGPSRVSLGGTPRWYAEIGRTDEGHLEYEFYPYDSNDAMVRYTGYKIPIFDELNEDSDIPVVVNPYILIEGVMIDVMRHKMALAADTGNADVAALWRNDYRAQETKWKRLKGEFELQSVSTDDSTFILASSHSIASFDHDVTTGREERVRNWSPLN